METFYLTFFCALVCILCVSTVYANEEDTDNTQFNRENREFRPLQFGKRDDFRPLQFGKKDSSFRPLQFGKRALNSFTNVDPRVPTIRQWRLIYPSENRWVHRIGVF